MTTKQLALKDGNELKNKQIAQEKLNRLPINNKQSVWLKPAPPTPALKNNKQEEETNRLIPCGNCGRAGHTVAACLNPHNPYAPN